MKNKLIKSKITSNKINKLIYSLNKLHKPALPNKKIQDPVWKGQVFNLEEKTALSSEYNILF